MFKFVLKKNIQKCKNFRIFYIFIKRLYSLTCIIFNLYLILMLTYINLFVCTVVKCFEKHSGKKGKKI